MRNENLAVIILAAGKGTRMNSELPKVLHHVNKAPMITKVIQVSYNINANPIIAIVGYKADLVKKALQNEKIEFIIQKEQ